MRFLYLRAFLLSLAVGLLCRNSFGQAAVAALTSRLVNQPVTVNLPELRLSKLPHAELKVVGGVPRTGMLNLKLDTDEVAHRNDTLTVREVEGFSDKKNDFLRITVVTSSGASAKLAFQLERGKLAEMDEASLEQVISPVLTPPTAKLSTRIAPAPISQSQAQPAPSRHLSTTVDLPAAAPGFPPMHAAGPAPDGCWYAPYASSTFAVEFAVIQCDQPTPKKLSVTESTTGLVGAYPGEDPQELFQVYTKRSDETFPAAIRRLVITKFKDPVARTACQVTSSPDANSNQPSFYISATGLYAKRKSYPLSPNGLPCDGFTSSEDIDVSFLAFPTESPNAFVLLRSGKGDPVFDSATIHFKVPEAAASGAVVATMPGDAKNAAPVQVDTASSNPVRGTWINKPAVRKAALSPDADTMGQTNIGLSGNSQLTTVLIGCVGPATSPHLELDALVPIYPGYTPSNVGTSATLLIGKSRRDVRMQSEGFSKSFLLSAPLTPEEADQINRNDLTLNGGISILFFAGAQRAVTTADLPEANAATDKVMQACHVPVVSHAHAAAFSAISPSQTKQLQLVKVALGMSPEQVKAAIGSGYRFNESPDGNVPSLHYIIALSNTSGYTFSFVNGSLQGFFFVQAYFPGSQPLVTNLIDGLVSKTWQPTNQTVNEFVSLGWGSDLAGNPITKYNLSTHPGCSNIGLSGLGSGAQDIQTPSHSGGGLSLIRLADAGPDCGVAISLTITRAKNDPNLAEVLHLAVSNQEVFRSIVHNFHGQQQQQLDEQHRKAGEIKNPF